MIRAIAVTQYGAMKALRVRTSIPQDCYQDSPPPGRYLDTIALKNMVYTDETLDSLCLSMLTCCTQKMPLASSNVRQ
jgi:hypothetical protein